MLFLPHRSFLWYHRSMNEIEQLIKNAHKNGISDIRLSDGTCIPLYIIRRKESQIGIYLKGFPSTMRKIPYDAIYDMSVNKKMPPTEIADILSSKPSTISRAIEHYHIVISDGTRAIMRARAYEIAAKKQKALFADPKKKAEMLHRREEASIKRFGTRNPMQSQQVKDKVNKTLEKRYGKGGSPFANAAVREKSRKTMMARYGVESSWEAEETKEKIRKTNIERYGVDNPMKSQKIRDKAIKTNMERYGVKWNTLSNEARAKAVKTYMSHYGVDNPSKSPEVLDKIAKSMKRGESCYEKMVSSLLNDLGVEYETNNHTLIGQELDFVIPSKRLAIEVSPSFTHHSNENKVLTVPPKKPSYHRKKHIMAEEKGYELITLFDSYLTKERWNMMTVPFLTLKICGQSTRTIYARNTYITHETSRKGRQECVKFISANHFNGNTPAQEYFSIKDKDGTIVGAFSLRKVRGKGNEFIELSRLAWKVDTQVRYGLSKVVHAISKTMKEATTLISYSDNDMGNGYSYKKSGFSYDGETYPGLHFVNPHDPMDSYSWQVATTWGAKQGVISRLIRPMEITKKEAKIIVEKELPHRSDNGKGYFAYYDSGNKKWSYDLNSIR